jgi:type IX secretion system PorP/SprF family membrane protein
MKLLFSTLFLLFISSSGLFGQLVPVTDHYVLNPLTISPAYAGNRGALNIAAFYRRQWVGIEGAPETATLTLDAPLFNSKLGLGLIISNDKIGVTKETRFMSDYAYKINMGEGYLSLGLGAGLISTNTAWADLSVIDQGDENYLVSSRVFVVPDFSFGAYYSRGNFFAGLSVPRLLIYKFDFDKNKYAMKFDPAQYYYLFHTGYLFSLAPKLKFLPSTLLSFSPGEELVYDLNAHFIIADRVWLGVSYRSNLSVAGLLQVAVTNQLRIAYSYDFDFSKLGSYSNGSHEIMIRYEFRYKINVVNPLTF